MVYHIIDVKTFDVLPNFFRFITGKCVCNCYVAEFYSAGNFLIPGTPDYLVPTSRVTKNFRRRKSPIQKIFRREKFTGIPTFSAGSY